MRIRSYDSVIINLGDFNFKDENKVEYIGMGRNYNFGEKRVIIFNKHTVAIIAAAIVAIIAVAIVAIIAAVIVAGLLSIGISIPEIVSVIHYWLFYIFIWFGSYLE